MAIKKNQIETKFKDIVEKINIDSTTTTDILEGLTENEKKTMCAEAHSLAGNKFFNKLCDFYINQRILDLAILAQDMEAIFAERAKIVGISELREQIVALSNIHKADNQPDERFDKNEVI